MQIQTARSLEWEFFFSTLGNSTLPGGGGRKVVKTTMKSAKLKGLSISTKMLIEGVKIHTNSLMKEPTWW